MRTRKLNATLWHLHQLTAPLPNAIGQQSFCKSGRSAKHIFILQMPRNIVSLFKRFSRQVFQNRTSSSCKPLCVINNRHTKMKKILLFTILSFKLFGQSPNLCGIWFGYNYGPTVEVMNIIQSGNSVVAIKLVGDPNVTAEAVSWFSIYSSNILTAHFTLGTITAPNSACGQYSLTVIDSTHITGVSPFSLYFVKASCNQIDSMKYNLDSLSINCICNTNIPSDTVIITKHDTIIVHDTIQITKYADTCLASISFPNIFTPNQDGINDFFTPVELRNLEIETFVILNRWGQQVYKTTSKISWNGQFNDKKASDGTYYFILYYKTKAGAKKSLNGFFTLIT